MRMRSLSLAVITVATVAGCATNPRIQGVEPEPPPPLRVWIGFPMGSNRVPIFVNRPAHVAMFEIIPGRGVAMVYPRTRAESYTFETHYADLTLQPGRMFYYSDPFGHASFQPRYYYAIASTAPLDLRRLQTSLGAVRRVLGRMYGSFRPYDVMDRVTELIVPMQPDEDWATDLFVDWPQPPMPRTLVQSYTRYRAITCANGRVLYVPRSYPYYGCPGDAPPAIVARGPAKEIPLDSAKAKRRQPPGDTRRSSESDAYESQTRRRAEAGARPPRTHGTMRSPSPEGVRHGDRVSGSTSSQPARSPMSEPASTSSRTERSQPAERSQPVERGEPRSGESGTARKP